MPDPLRCATRILIGEVPSSIATAAWGHNAQLVVTGRVPQARRMHEMLVRAALRRGASGERTAREDAA